MMAVFVLLYWNVYRKREAPGVYRRVTPSTRAPARART